MSSSSSRRVGPAPGSTEQVRTEEVARLVPVVYERLRRVARRHLKSQRAGHTLDSAALVHEVYLKLAMVEEGGGRWEDRKHFLATAILAMRTILVDHARRRQAQRRGGGDAHSPIEEVDESELMSQAEAERLLGIERALAHLAQSNAEAARLVEYRCFGDLTVEEAAAVLGMSYATARRRWDFAKAWLQREFAQA